MHSHEEDDLISFSDLDFKQLLGNGAFGTVHMAQWRMTPVAVKTAKKETTEFQKKLFMRELETLTRIRHPNVVQFLGFCVEPFCIALEYLPNSDLRTFCQRAKPNQSHKLRISIDIMRGLAYLHNRKPASVIHRDIKPTNVLISPSGTAKISDFGLAKMARCAPQEEAGDPTGDDGPSRPSTSGTGSSGDERRRSSGLSGNVGTQRYMAPEAHGESYTCAVDVFSAGATLYELFEGDLFTGLQWALAPAAVRPPITAMCAQKPESRPTALESIEAFEALQEQRAKGLLHRVVFASRSKPPPPAPRAAGVDVPPLRDPLTFFSKGPPRC